LLRRKSAEAEVEQEPVADEEVDAATGRSYTPAKGRPTPKRRDAHKQRGPVAPPPRTQREAMKRSRGNKVERKEASAARRKAAAERRERMAAGDDKYLLPRDKGPVRGYVRDLVDTRRSLVGLFMPLAGVIFLALFVPNPAITNIITLACTMLLLAMLLEGLVVGRNVVRRVRAKFPDAPDRSLSLGWYAFVRASQIRRIRMPKPRVKPGEAPPK
jgi:hypothetical protein